MRRPAVYVALLAVFVSACGGAAPPPDTEAIAPASSANAEAPDFTLVGNRFAPLTWDDMTDEQRTMLTSILAGPRGGALGGPFNVMLRSPRMGDLAQELGGYIRFNVSIPDTIREMAIIMTARHWTAHFEWYAHKNAALRVGLNPAIVDAIAAGQRPEGMSAEEEVLYDFCSEMLDSDTHQVTDATFDAAIEAFGERGVVDIVGTVGYYGLVSMLLNVDEYPLPDGAEIELHSLSE